MVLYRYSHLHCNMRKKRKYTRITCVYAPKQSVLIYIIMISIIRNYVISEVNNKTIHGNYFTARNTNPKEVS
jgi:hypothetical protein